MEFLEKTIDSEQVFTGRIVKLKVDTVRLPSGNLGKREIIEHPGAVAIVALDNEQQIWMVKQFRKPTEEVLIEIPAGTLKDNEEPLDCAKRELSEETGLQAASWKEILSYYSAPGFCSEKIYLFLATGLEAGAAHPDPDEMVETIKIPIKQAYNMIFEGKIKDGKSIIGIQYAYWLGR
ncbi:MAG: NUDIX hydrolase [Syntrophomonadaceae bacterium]|jgi:ADP-ribose pyrophosphatase